MLKTTIRAALLISAIGFTSMAFAGSKDARIKVEVFNKDGASLSSESIDSTKPARIKLISKDATPGFEQLYVDLKALPPAAAVKSQALTQTVLVAVKHTYEVRRTAVVSGQAVPLGEVTTELKDFEIVLQKGEDAKRIADLAGGGYIQASLVE